MTQTFADKLEKAQAASHNAALYIAPKIERMPAAFQRHDDPFLPYMRSVFQATQYLVCVYIFDFSDYLALGAAGIIALERSIALTLETHITILDARFATGNFSRVWDESAFGCDAVTITAEAPQPAFQTRSDRQAFTISDSEAYPARYDPLRGFIVLGQQTIPVLPLATLDGARSLSFEETLSQAVRAYVLG